MKLIQLSIHLTEELGIKKVIFEYNDTGLPSDSVLISNLAYTLLKSVILNKEDCEIQDLLSELNIKREE